MRPIAIFHHTCLNLGTPAHANFILKEQVDVMTEFGLLDAAQHVFVGVNGPAEDVAVVASMHHPKAVVFPNPKNEWPGGEVPTLRALRDFCLGNPSLNVLYLHMKGLTHVPGSHGHGHNTSWRHNMTHVVVKNWKRCVELLDGGFESVGNWWNVAPNGSYWAGNFWWATSDFISTLPPIVTDGHHSGGRYEAEVWIGRGPRLPKIVAL